MNKNDVSEEKKKVMKYIYIHMRYTHWYLNT